MVDGRLIIIKCKLVDNSYYFSTVWSDTRQSHQPLTFNKYLY